MKPLVYLFVIFSIIYLSNAAYKPKYIVPCSRSHNFTECAIRSAQYAIPFLVKGDKRLKIPSLSPLNIELVELKGTNNLDLKLRNVKVYGLENLRILNVSMDFDGQKARIISKLNESTILGTYEIYGRIVIPITGHGPANITMYNGTYVYDAEWTFDIRDGKKYMSLTKSKYDYQAAKIIYDFKNLLNGGYLGEEMNKILNENWRDVNEDLKAPFLETLTIFHNDISNKIFSKIPYDELFLD